MYNKLVYSSDDIYRKVRRHKLRLAIIASSVTFFIIMAINSGVTSDFLMKFNPLEDISCHYIESDNVLESVNDMNPSSDAIFFHETSCRGVLDSRQACSVESAARAHPNREIYVIFSSPVNRTTFDSEPLASLRTFTNIKFRRVLILDYARGTPVEQLVHGGALNRTLWKISHTSDVLRYITLYKWSGLYLDLDTVVLRSVDDLPRNFATRENDYFVASSALGFYKDKLGRMVANLSIWDQAKSFRGDVWGQNGPMLITRVLRGICETDDPTLMSADTCQGFEVYGPELFFPIGPISPGDFFKSGELELVPHAFFYHIWNAQTQHLKVEVDSPYAKLAEIYCPEIYRAYGHRFGD